MKLSELKTALREVVKEVIQEELKDILLEAIKSPKQSVSQPITQSVPQPMDAKSKQDIRESYMNVLGGMMPNQNGTISANTNSMPLQINGPVDTTSPNGSLPTGNVSMDQIMGLMNKG